ncbi:response regulator [Microseira sp. BLCC-F43]|jgi:diguanylate cyclase (GGDEF)-like protein|uniref:response regulator n=1 Tax=Microseira sp. BLCC-F43 TaxID=3153602 RepID=UPI0035B8956B
MRILVVEDDKMVSEALTNVLGDQNYAVEVAKDGEAGWELVEAFAYDLILLDVILPKLDGISLCQRLRSQGYNMPVLLLTGKDSSHDKATGLNAGADDYLVKPFDPEELVARVRALLRRGNSISLPILEWGSLKLDPTTHEATYDVHPLHLTPKEYAMLELFLRNSRRVFSCGGILEHIWSYEETPGEEAVRTHIKGLRQKLKAAGAPTDLIETVYGIGYRLKPLDALGVPNSPLETNEQPTKAQTTAAIAGVWNRFKDRIGEQVEVLAQTAAALSEGKITPELHAQAEREAHTLAGSLGTFGFSEGSQVARKIERLLQATNLGRKDAVRLGKLVKSLRTEINRPLQETAKEPAIEKDERPLLLIVAPDSKAAKPLVTEAANWEIRAEIATNLPTAREKIEREHPNAVLLELDLEQVNSGSLSLLAELSQRTPPVPVLVLTEQNGLERRAGSTLQERLEVARLGGRAFLQKPVSPSQVIEAVTQVLQRADAGAARIVVVDDDAQILATLRNLLEPWGMKVRTLEDPRRFWETLEATMPDLLILDIKMPHINGIELCQVVRNDARWSGLPILFLTAYTDANTVNQVFAAGADDFVSKPIVGPELVTRIVNRLERIKLLRSLAETDPLTRVCNRYKSTTDLNRFLSLAKRYNQPLSLAIVDLDRFKQVNDRYGHDVGDSVLRQIGQILLRSFRSEDVVARWGGEEFIVGMYGMTKSDGVQRLRELLEIVRQQKFAAHGGIEFQVTMSGGIAEYPKDGTDLQSLYRSADAALYQAKLAGRDRIMGNE